jgi:hypothetical protein
MSTEKFVVVEWSKMGRELEDVTEFNSREEANKFATWLGSRKCDFNGNFIGDPRWGVDVVLKSKWENRDDD